MAWDDLMVMYAAVAAALGVALAGTLLPRHFKVFEAIKLGMVT